MTNLVEAQYVQTGESSNTKELGVSGELFGREGKVFHEALSMPR